MEHREIQLAAGRRQQAGRRQRSEVRGRRSERKDSVFWVEVRSPSFRNPPEVDIRNPGKNNSLLDTGSRLRLVRYDVSVCLKIFLAATWPPATILLSVEFRELQRTTDHGQSW